MEELGDRCKVVFGYIITEATLTGGLVCVCVCGGGFIGPLIPSLHCSPDESSIVIDQRRLWIVSLFLLLVIHGTHPIQTK